MKPLQAPLVVGLAAVALSGSATAVEKDCFSIAAARYQVGEGLLLAIAKIESNFEPRAVAYASDGTHSVGVMQINSSHFDRLRDQGISEDTLLNRPCTNVAVGASILAEFIQRFGVTWRAVGAYGAGTSPKKEGARRDYAARVAGALERWRAGRAIQLAGRPDTSPVRLLVLD